MILNSWLSSRPFKVELYFSEYAVSKDLASANESKYEFAFQ